MRQFPQTPTSQRLEQTLCIWLIHRTGSVGMCPQLRPGTWEELPHIEGSDFRQMHKIG